MKRLTYWFIIVYGICICAGCVTVTIPEDVIPQEKMKILLKEFHLANAISQRLGQSLEERSAGRQELFSAILVREGETRESFLRSYMFYLDHPTFMDEIYSQIVEEFNEEVTIEEDFRYNKLREAKDAYINKIKAENQDSIEIRLKNPKPEANTPTFSTKPAEKPNKKN